MGAIPRDRRVTTRGEILGLLRGPVVHGADLDLYWRPASGGTSRATCITPKYGHTSVERNRLRRRLTALLASELLSRPEPRDYLVRARRGAYDRDFEELSRAVRSLAKEIAKEKST